eukprot:TRINITY_DN65666_c0_g1_i1.p2 TRINITY_DN65666_c0_g1~~TRINITY_DN65666_c0_g1_i1.p2  ORF type:complete len:122 (-),score=22.03 TRINITY_DN65666_c0_g1_i1:45-410(-)
MNELSIVIEPQVNRSEKVCGATTKAGRKFNEISTKTVPIEKVTRKRHSLRGSIANEAAPDARSPATDSAPLAAPAADEAPSLADCRIWDSPRPSRIDDAEEETLVETDSRPLETPLCNPFA